MVLSYYNDNDPAVCAWVQNLVDAGELPPGDVDCKSITEVCSNDLSRYTQCHFFCGIAGWPVALALAGWPADRPVWTGSCPCQPFSGAGRRAGHEDARHLWPEFFRLIRECRPPSVFGEQVASPLGRMWLAAVRADLETVGYAVGGADLCAAGIGAPHIRQRLYWVGNTDGMRQSGQCGRGETRVAESSAVDSYRNVEWVYCRDGKYRPVEPRIAPLAHGVPGRVVKLCAYGNAIHPVKAAEFIMASEEAACAAPQNDNTPAPTERAG